MPFLGLDTFGSACKALKINRAAFIKTKIENMIKNVTIDRYYLTF